MVVDSSVLIAILLQEAEAKRFTKFLIDADSVYISAVSIVESSMVIEYKKGEQQYDELLKTITPTVVSFDVQQATLARIAWRAYGKGRHPAKLNFGDCCSYATAKHLKQPLLFKGNDFSQTDIEIAS
ncbi:type II toxin-antitoxin system VapC family toxin [Methyloprofundus sp.]|uniref:type II toxin-antitoxin system VapC family toxin n=1 Tax=Methyloprofundus sp. TaxID=2020875 RepID=UPI003D1331D0